MSKETPIINILTYKLPYKLTNQIYNEYQNRLKEANYLIENYEPYKSLNNQVRVVELFLALSIFHKRIITNLDGAVKFHKTVTTKGETDTVQIGSYKLTTEEKNKILAVVLNYQELLNKFSIHPGMMEYFETKELLRNIIEFKSDWENGVYYKKSKTKENNGENDDNDIPF